MVTPISTLPWSGYSTKTTQKLPWTGYSQKAVTPTVTDAYDTQIDAFNKHLQEFYTQDRGDQTYMDYLNKTYPTDAQQLTDDFIGAVNQTQPELLGAQVDFFKAHPVEETFLDKLKGLGGEVLGAISKLLEYGLYPFTAAGMAIREYGGLRTWETEAIAKLVPLTEEEEKKFREVAEPMAVHPEFKIKEWLPGGEKHKEFQELPWYQQLAFEAPAWIALIGFLPSATSLRAGLAAPAKVGGVKGAAAVVARGALAPVAGYEAVINKLIQLPVKAVSSGTRKVLESYINKNAKYIRLIATQRDPTTFSLKERILYKLFNLHNRYMTEQAAAAIAAQRAARVGVTNKVNADIAASTQTMGNIVAAVQSGKELTTTSIQGLVVSGTPTEFTSGINAIIAGQAVTTVTGAVPEGVEFRSITTKVGKGYEILQNNEVVGTVSYSTEVPGVDGIVMDRIDIAEAARRQGLATQAVQRILSEAESQGVPLYTGIMEPDGVQLFNALEQRGIVSLTPAPERMLGNVVTRGVPEYAPTTAMAEWDEVTGEIPTEGKIIPKEGMPEVTGATNKQKAKAHILAQEKALVNPKTGGASQQYRRLAQNIVGKKSMAKMTQAEASAFIEALERYPERKWSAQTGTWIPQAIPKTTAIVPENYFNLKFGEPTPIKYFTSQNYYATKLGVGQLTEPLEIAKQELDLVYPAWRNAIDAKIAELNKVYKVTTAEKLAAKKANKPTRASVEMAQLLNRYEDLPSELVDKLGMEKVKIFSWFRNLSRTILNGQNQVRHIMGMPAIPHREAYFSHIASRTAEEVMYGMYPLPSDLAYWSKQVVGKRVFNARAIQRQLRDDLLEYFSRDLGYVTKSMVNTALKEIYLSQPLKAFNAQINALNKSLMPFDSLSPAEMAKALLINPLPASTRKWLVDYVNIVIKGQQTELDASINRIITNTGIGGIFDKFLLPFGRSVGLKPVTKISQFLGRSIIYATIGTKPRQIIRNLWQTTQSIALNGIVPTLKAFLPADKNLTRMLDSSLFLKSYAMIEEMPTTGMSKVARVWMWAYGKSAVFNAKISMKASYHSKLHYVINGADAQYGWADPARTYNEPEGFLYDSEFKRLQREAEFASGAAQYQYNPLGMPEVYRHKTLVPLTRLQSWWMNYFFKFHREAFGRFWNGHVGWDSDLKLNWRDRLNWLKYIIIGGAVLTAMGYNRSFGKDVLPHWAPPGAQLVTGVYNYIIADSDYAREQAKRQMFYSLRAFVPGLIDYNQYKDIWSGEKPLSSLFFYTEDWPPDMPTWGISALVTEIELKHRIKGINEDIEEWTNKLGQLIPAEDEVEAYTYETSDFASDLWAVLRNIPEAYITKEKGFPGIALLYQEGRPLMDAYYELPASERQDFILQNTSESINTGAHLVLWGKLKATGWASGNPQTITLVEKLVEQYNIPIEAVPSLGELKEKGAVEQTPSQGGLPWSGGGGTPSTGGLPWSGYSSK